MTASMYLPLPYGLRDCKVTPYTDKRATTLSDTVLDLPNAQTMHFSDVVNFSDVPGLYEVLLSAGAEQGGTWSLGSGGLPLDVLAALTGVTLNSDGVMGLRTVSYRRNVRNVRPWFKAEGQSLTDDDGDVHATLYRCRATGEIAGELSDSTFYITSLSGVYLPANTLENDGDLFDITRNENATAIVVL